MIEFEVSKAFEIPTWKDDHDIWHLRTEKLNAFWEECDPEHFGMRNGCYILGMGTKNIKPWYVGKTWKGFRNETFKSHQQTKISRFLNHHGTPVVVFVYKKFKNYEGAQAKALINSLENFLIQTAVSVNPDLLNVHGTKNAQWAIKGVIRSPQKGKKAKELVAFKQMLRL